MKLFRLLRLLRCAAGGVTPPGMETVETVRRDAFPADDTARHGALRDRLWAGARRAAAEFPEIQLPRAGVGRLIHRRYRVTFVADATPCGLIETLRAEPNAACHPALARFKKTRGDAGAMEVGDRYLISITAPWDGPVQVIEADDAGFALVTLEGHLEAGFIRFGADAPGGADGPGERSFAIESWATSGGPLVWFTYTVLGVTRRMQTAMWRYYCLRAAQLSGATDVGPLTLTTEAGQTPGQLPSDENLVRETPIRETPADA